MVKLWQPMDRMARFCCGICKRGLSINGSAMMHQCGLCVSILRGKFWPAAATIKRYAYGMCRLIDVCGCCGVIRMVFGRSPLMPMVNGWQVAVPIKRFGFGMCKPERVCGFCEDTRAEFLR